MKMPAAVVAGLLLICASKSLAAPPDIPFDDNIAARRGFVDTAAWMAMTPLANERGDSNAVTGGWCGNMIGSCAVTSDRPGSSRAASDLDIRLSIVGFALKYPKTQNDLAGFAQATTMDVPGGW